MFKEYFQITCSVESLSPFCSPHYYRRELSPSLYCAHGLCGSVIWTGSNGEPSFSFCNVKVSVGLKGWGLELSEVFLTHKLMIDLGCDLSPKLQLMVGISICHLPMWVGLLLTLVTGF